MTKGISSLWWEFSPHYSCVLGIHNSFKPVLIPSPKIFGTVEAVWQHFQLRKCGIHLDGLSDEAVAGLVGAKNTFLDFPFKAIFDDQQLPGRHMTISETSTLVPTSSASSSKSESTSGRERLAVRRVRARLDHHNHHHNDHHHGHNHHNHQPHSSTTPPS